MNITPRSITEFHDHLRALRANPSHHPWRHAAYNIISTLLREVEQLDVAKLQIYLAKAAESCQAQADATEAFIDLCDRFEENSEETEWRLSERAVFVEMCRKQTEAYQELADILSK